MCPAEVPASTEDHRPCPDPPAGGHVVSMTIAPQTSDHAEAVAQSPAPSARVRHGPPARMMRGYCATIAVGLVAMVGFDGSPPWRVVRVVLVAIACSGPLLAAARFTPRVAAGVAVVLGTVAATVGLTVGYSFLARTGMSAKAFGAVLAAAGGLAALVAGVRSLLRSRGWARLAALPIGLVVVYALVMPLATAVYATNVPRPRLGSTTPADRGIRYEDASFVTTDSVRLAGWYLPSTNRAGVVLLHGASSTRSNVLDQAAVLNRLGCGVLLFDARGHGESGGRAMEFGWYGDRDVAAGVSYLVARPDVDPHRIGAVGMSMGGEQALGAMAADDRVRAVVAEGATNRAFADKEWLATEYGLRGRIQQGVEWITYGLTDLLTGASPPISLRDAAVTAARPVLLIVAGTMSNERLSNEVIRAAAPATVEVWVVPGAGHTGGLRTQPQEWERRVQEFLQHALLGSS